jgi:hypothetical protein
MDEAIALVDRRAGKHPLALGRLPKQSVTNLVDRGWHRAPAPFDSHKYPFTTFRPAVAAGLKKDGGEL